MDQLIMHPATGEHVLRFVGDRIAFTLAGTHGQPLPPGWKAFLRTTLGRGEAFRREIIHAHKAHRKLANAPWRDIPLFAGDMQWRRELCLTETGSFRAKAYAVDPQGRQYWPAGPDVGINVHPDAYRSANTIYCAFVRMFGPNRTKVTTDHRARDAMLANLEKQGFATIPPSGTFRDLIQQLPHIIDTLGCRILHLLPVNPTPATYGRFGRFGSPYAARNLAAVDPALIDFDKRTTGIDQFRELTYATHVRGGRVFLDIVANHTGWSSLEHETHPEWFLRNERGEFVSPGAWGTIWEDLVELDHRNAEVWEYLADVFLTWCRRGVDGFRCDAGYKIPPRAWQYITARVIDEFPETIFLLEGLGGSWEATEKLLTEGGMQWAYSELFQNYSGEQVAWYLDYGLRQSERVGVYVNYSETHDNERLASKGREWSLLRNRLCALTSVNGAFGFTCGVEWLAPERVNVHSSRGLAWGRAENIVTELSQLSRLLQDHPCFLDGAKLTRLSPPRSPVFALSRVSAEGLDKVLVLANTDSEEPQRLALKEADFEDLGAPMFDLLSGRKIKMPVNEFLLQPAQCLCLSASEKFTGLGGEEYRRKRALSAWAIQALRHVMAPERIGAFDWRKLADWVEAGPRRFLTALADLDLAAAETALLRALQKSADSSRFSPVIEWSLIDSRRVTLVPPGHWFLVRDEGPFRATLDSGGPLRHDHSVQAGTMHVTAYPPETKASEARLFLERYGGSPAHLTTAIRFLGAEPLVFRHGLPQPGGGQAESVLLTNGVGGMARLQVNLGTVKSKYDCVLGANLHPSVPVDRHIFVKRIRVWVVADGFISTLNQESLIAFTPGPPAQWRFVAGAGEDRSVEIQLVADMLHGENTTVLRFSRPSAEPAEGHDLPPHAKVTLTVRVDIEDRNFHTETHRNGAAEWHFTSNTRPLGDQIGFEFMPASDRQLRVTSDGGQFNPEPEWSQGIWHPIENSRGLPDHSDVFSPGWFNLPMDKGTEVRLVLTAEPKGTNPNRVTHFEIERKALIDAAVSRAGVESNDTFGRQLALAVQAFLVRRGQGKTVIAGYPWFLDWGRDSLICARGMLAAGLVDEVRELLITYGRFEHRGTLPNSIFGEDASNRDTSDAPLWFGIVCEEAAAIMGQRLYSTSADGSGRDLARVLRDIASGYIEGTPNGIRMDPASALIWSPSHFTWMDTNYPAGTPREGYPIEIQVLWIRLLRQLARLDIGGHPWEALARQAEEKLQSNYWLNDGGYYADLLVAAPGKSAAEAVVDNALRSNFLFGVSLGLFGGERAQRGVAAAAKYLVVPGALRTLAPLPVFPPLPVYGRDGQLLNHPNEPYLGTYEGDEDSRRKPAYHNGTAWVWTLPSFCEALARAWSWDPRAVAAARAYLGSLDRLLNHGCAGHLPEITDGDAPHLPRGCDAQSWSVTEALRVWKLLRRGAS
jgi:starch synthase (maltosyl-transferring)